jgi:hypothetical protein
MTPTFPWTFSSNRKHALPKWTEASEFGGWTLVKRTQDPLPFNLLLIFLWNGCCFVLGHFCSIMCHFFDALLF